jgi:hypothetical protein
MASCDTPNWAAACATVRRSTAKSYTLSGTGLSFLLVSHPTNLASRRVERPTYGFEGEHRAQDSYRSHGLSCSPRNAPRLLQKMATWQMRGLSKARYYVVASTRQGRGLTPHSYPRPLFTANSLQVWSSRKFAHPMRPKGHVAPERWRRVVLRRRRGVSLSLRRAKPNQARAASKGRLSRGSGANATTAPISSNHEAPRG